MCEVDTMKKRLISSYDEVNDTFVGKVDGENGFCADYGIANGVFLGIDKDNFPNLVFVNNASEVLNTSKQILENSNVKISIECDAICLYFNMFIEGLKICSIRCKNSFGIPNINFEIDSNH
ncbi:hypothetical protein [Methanobrevibacter sp.]|uniref:hypothetical protein n=1 Tax=Methanobrevibacter sp. TaxID=66852 RepID=UPI003863FA3E